MSAIPLSTFRVSDNALNRGPAIKDAYGVFSEKHFGFSQAVTEFREASKKLHSLLDGRVGLARLRAYQLNIGSRTEVRHQS
jgi:hypothetical protein